mmetsp:Transcript_11112/g.19838  ORF Transcript_11112/g.19838 Transcript_11112/m.19838 type:complete len:242 (-) Transcript_11112:5573-6298(-)
MDQRFVLDMVGGTKAGKLNLCVSAGMTAPPALVSMAILILFLYCVSAQSEPAATGNRLFRFWTSVGVCTSCMNLSGRVMRTACTLGVSLVKVRPISICVRSLGLELDHVNDGSVTPMLTISLPWIAYAASTTFWSWSRITIVKVFTVGVSGGRSTASAKAYWPVVSVVCSRICIGSSMQSGLSPGRLICFREPSAEQVMRKPGGAIMLIWLPSLTSKANVNAICAFLTLATAGYVTLVPPI